MEHCVSAEGAGLRLGNRQVLSNINLRVKRGEFITVLGRSGSGKTTLLKTLLGFYRPQAGSIYVAGEKVAGKGIKLVRQRTGYMPQSVETSKDFPITAGDVITLGAGGNDPSPAINELNIRPLLKCHFGSLSGGEKQKVLLAMVLARRPGVLLLDEPNLNLDMKSYAEFLRSVEKVHKKYSHTVIFVTHLISHIPGSCKRIVVMREGRIVHDGPKAGVLKKKDMTEFLYGQR